MAAAAAAIRPISEGDIHRITSGQVVLDLQTAVKELVENALDAGATNIEVRFKDYGAEAIEVIDNGSGIDATNYEGIALKHHTSKLASFSDLALVRTFGFRGEALSSLCALGQVSLHTATVDDAPVGTLIELDHAGTVRAKDKKAARQRGTTVTVTGLFNSLPVRRKEFVKNLKREYAKTQNLLQAYALISKGVRWTSSNQPRAGKRTPQFSVSSSTSTSASSASASNSNSSYLVSNASALFGARVGPTLMPLNLTLSFEPVRSPYDDRKQRRADADVTDEGKSEVEAETGGGDDNDDYDEQPEASETTAKVVGLISKPTLGNGRSSSDRQFFYINGRPWEAGRISRAFNEIYKQYNTSQVPFVIADFRLPTDSYDVNVSPDKRTIFLHEEARLVEKVKEKLDEIFAPTRGVFRVGGAGQSLRALAVTQSKLTGFEPRLASRRLATQVMEATATDGDDNDDDDDHERPSMVRRDRGEDADSAASEDEPHDTIDSQGGPNQVLSQEVQRTTGDAVHVVAPKDDSLQGDDTGSPTAAEGERWESPQPPERMHKATLDTTRASWSPAKRLRQTPAHVTSSSSSPSLDCLLGSPSQPSSPSSRREERPKVDLIKSLTSLALPGSQISEMLRARRQDEAGMLDGDRLQRLEYAEEGVAEEQDMDLEGDAVQRGESDEDETGPLSSIVGSEPEPEDDELAQGRASDGADETSHCACPHEHDVPMDLIEGKRQEETADAEERLRNLAALNETLEGENEEEPIQSVELEPPTTAATGADAGADADLGEEGGPTLRFDLDAIRQRLRRRASLLRGESAMPSSIHAPSTLAAGEADGAESAAAMLAAAASAGLQEAGITNRDAASVEASLNRIIHKSDFVSMEVIGQFNLGFIIARRRLAPSLSRPASDAAPLDTDSGGAMDDLFIIDQHASDEKYNFETLQLETKIQSQRLILPRPLELSASNELVAGEHIETLKRNGFEIEVEENGLPGRRIKLIAQPVSKGTVFGVKDLEELLYLLRDITPSSPATLSVRCTKARAMFASRACRRSVMIGTALQHRQMKRILQHMGEIEQPWNCPHGRPTMRHLVCLRATDRMSSQSRQPTTGGTAKRRHGEKKVEWRKMMI